MSDTTNRMKCMICGKPVGKEQLYCAEHKAYAEADDKILQEAPMELLFSLIAGIFIRARADYEMDIKDQKDDAVRFLRSDWAQMLSLSHFDPDEAIKAMDEEKESGINWFRTDIERSKWQ